MTPEQIKPQPVLEIAAMRCQLIIAELDQEVIFKLIPEAEVQGVFILWQPPLPSIH